MVWQCTLRGSEKGRKDKNVFARITSWVRFHRGDERLNHFDQGWAIGTSRRPCHVDVAGLFIEFVEDGHGLRKFGMELVVEFETFPAI